jgi:phage terminase large subunit-like protein
MPSPHVNKANQYRKDIASGKIDACKWVKLACERQTKDLALVKDKDWPYRFDKEAAERVCKFISRLPHVKGKWAGSTIDLEGWQCFVLTTTFGWVNKNDGLRRYRVAYEEVPRKNAKSTIAAGVGIYMLALDGEPGAEVYSAATTKDQANIIFGVAKQMTKKNNSDSGFRNKFEIGVGAHALYIERDANIFKALAADSNTLDGLNPHCPLIDELHAHKTRGIYDVMETGMGARSQPLMFIVTTAGTDTAGICYEQRNYVTKILEGVIEDETYFGIIYTVDEEDEWTDPGVWQKANPNWDVSVYPDDIKRLAKKAINTPSAANTFKKLRLNVWAGADSQWINLEKLKRGIDLDMKMEDFAGSELWVGIDFAEKWDIAAMIFLFRQIDERGLRQYYLFNRFYLPETTIQESKNASYSGWVDQGHLISTPGNIIDYDIIEEDLRKVREQMEIKEVVIDPWHSQQFAAHMINEGMEVVAVPAGSTQVWSGAARQFEAIYFDKRFHWDGNPVYYWMASNAVAHEDAKGNIFPRKDKKLPQNKIDGIAATLLSFTRAEPEDPEEENPYDKRGLTII